MLQCSQETAPGGLVVPQFVHTQVSSTGWLPEGGGGEARFASLSGWIGADGTFVNGCPQTSQKFPPGMMGLLHTGQIPVSIIPPD